MKKRLMSFIIGTVAIILLNPLMVSANNFNSNSYTSDTVPNGSYFIGTYHFSKNYSLTVRYMMVAARTITSDNPDHMIAYYKDLDGNWVESISGNPIVPLPNYTATHEDMVSVLTTNVNNLIDLAENLLDEYPSTSATYNNLETVLTNLKNAITANSGVETAYNSLVDAIAEYEEEVANIALANTFITNYNTVLELTTSNVAISNKAAIEVAKTAYNNLNLEVKTLVNELYGSSVITHLNDLLNKITDILDNLANTFKTTYSNVLAIVVDEDAYINLYDSDLFNDLDAAALELEGMDANILALLSTESTKIAALKAIVDPIRREIFDYGNKYGTLFVIDITEAINTYSEEELADLRVQLTDALDSFENMSTIAQDDWTGQVSYLYYMAGAIDSYNRELEIAIYVANTDEDVFRLLLDFYGIIDDENLTFEKIETFVNSISPLVTKINNIKTGITNQFTESKYENEVDNYINTFDYLIAIPNAYETGISQAEEFINNYTALLGKINSGTYNETDEATFIEAIEAIEDYMNYEGPTGSMINAIEDDIYPVWLQENLWNLFGFEGKLVLENEIDLLAIYTAKESLES